MIDSAKVKDTLFKACKNAGVFQLKHFDQPIESVVKESISSIVTFVDINSENIIIDIIKEAFPYHNILSEECGFKDNNSNYTWIIDPLDGTSNYAAGLPWFGVLIALVKDDVAIFGAAYIPSENHMFYAEKGKGAFLNNEQLRIKDKPLSQCLFAFSTDYCKDQEYLNKGIEIYKYIVQNSRNVRTTNSLIDLVNVATGKLGGCVNLFNCIWDIAATSLIIEESGGKISRLDGSPLIFNVSDKGVIANYDIISGNLNIHNQILTAIKNI